MASTRAGQPWLGEKEKRDRHHCQALSPAPAAETIIVSAAGERLVATKTQTAFRWASPEFILEGKHLATHKVTLTKETK